MPLTSEQYEQLTQLLGAPPRAKPDASYPGPERRQSPRLPARGPAELRLPEVGATGGRPRGPRTVTVYVHDISTGGLGLLSGTPVKPWSGVEVLLSNGYDDVTVRCAVRHCTMLAVGLYGVGVDVVAYEARQAEPESAAAEAVAAWAGYFASDPASGGAARGR